MRSPILRAEFSHQTTAGGSTARPLRLIVRLILIVGLATSLLVTGMEFWAAIDWNFSGFLIQSDALIVIVGHVLPSVILLPLTLMVDVVLVLRTLLLAADAIARERRGRTWQLLILSAQTPRQLVIDKWWATVLHFTPQYLLLAALRVGVIVYIGLERYRIDYFYYGINSHRFLMQTQPLTFLVAPSTLILGAAVITAFTLVNLLFTAALGGLMAAIWRSGRTVEQMIFALVLRGVLLGFPALLLWSTVAGSPFYDCGAAADGERLAGRQWHADLGGAADLAAPSTELPAHANGNGFLPTEPDPVSVERLRCAHGRCADDRSAAGGAKKLTSLPNPKIQGVRSSIFN